MLILRPYSLVNSKIDRRIYNRNRNISLTLMYVRFWRTDPNLGLHHHQRQNNDDTCERNQETPKNPTSLHSVAPRERERELSMRKETRTRPWKGPWCFVWWWWWMMMMMMMVLVSDGYAFVVVVVVVEPFVPLGPSLRVATRTTTTTSRSSRWFPPSTRCTSVSSTLCWATKKPTTNTNQNNNPWTIQDDDLLHKRYDSSQLEAHIVNTTDYDSIVIGSGIGGLWLAACLSKLASQKVLVLEQHDIVGGFQHSFHRKGYEFVPGLHYLANLPLCAPLLEMVATAPPTVPPLVYETSGNSTTHDTGQSHTLQVGRTLPELYVRQGIDKVQDELTRAFPDERHAISQFCQLMERSKWQAGQYATFKIFSPPIQWILSQVLCSNYIHYASLTTKQVLDPLSRNGGLQTVLSAFGGDLGESLADGSFVMQAAVLGHVLEGCHYPQGGPLQFVRHLVPTIRQAHGDVLVKARVQNIVMEHTDAPRLWPWRDGWWGRNKYKAVGVQLDNGHVLRAKHGVISDAGIATTLQHLVPSKVYHDNPRLQRLRTMVERVSSGAISHVFAFVGMNASTEELKLQSSSFYYIPWNETNATELDATAIQEFYRNTLLDPSVLDVSAGMVFCTAKDPVYSETTMPGLSTAIVFSEARAKDFEQFTVVQEDDEDVAASGKGKRPQRKKLRTKEYKQAKKLIEQKMMRSLLLNFPHLEPYIDFVEIGTPLTLMDYTLRTETLGLRHTPERMTNQHIGRPECAGIDNLYFTGQDVAFAGWAGALTGAMVCAQKILGYTLLDFAQGKTLMRDLGRGDVEDMIQAKVQEATKASPLEVMTEIVGNAVRHLQQRLNTQ